MTDSAAVVAVAEIADVGLGVFAVPSVAVADAVVVDILVGLGVLAVPSVAVADVVVADVGFGDPDEPLEIADVSEVSDVLEFGVPLSSPQAANNKVKISKIGRNLFFMSSPFI